jgi:TonB-dependent starch-binding outer membrane protein SusC
MKNFTLFIALALFFTTAFTANGFAQGGTVKGSVVDSEKLPLIGVNISVKGTTIGTVTDIDGKFILSNVPAGSQEILASFIGYLSETKIVDASGGKTVEINFVLIEDIAELSEVVVIGYGVQKNRTLPVL